LVCPPEHISAARERLSAAEALNLLVIGYSGLDQEVLRFLAESGRGVRSLLVANGTEEASAEAAERLASSCGATVRVREGSIFAGGFADLVKSGKLREFVRTLS
jgi:glutamyl-tRNA reductase